MALLLCIDTALNTANIGLANGDNVLVSEVNTDQKNHAAFIQVAIRKIMQSEGLSFQDIDAVALVNGPGSYTGLRVGLASAKGLCYAAGKPLLLMNTLPVMAKAAAEAIYDANALYCPMIDARRNEVFTALYHASLEVLIPPHPMIIDEKSFIDILNNKKIYFFGSGHNKCENLIWHENALFTEVTYTLRHINELAQQMYAKEQFTNIAYAEPFYAKNFYMPERQ